MGAATIIHRHRQVSLDAACINVLLCSMAAGAAWHQALTRLESGSGHATQRGAVTADMEAS